MCLARNHFDHSLEIKDFFWDISGHASAPSIVASGHDMAEVGRVIQVTLIIGSCFVCYNWWYKKKSYIITIRAPVFSTYNNAINNFQSSQQNGDQVLKFC